ncbi:MAG TPA: DUF2203 domain-containing protein [Ktedonobacteraceae bacterium]|jgi:hypothetical protein
MTRYFTREAAEALLPQVSVVLRDIQREHAAMKEHELALEELEIRAKGNGHHLHEHIAKIQQELAKNVQALRSLMVELEKLGCELKDPETGLVDFLGLRDGREIYLCWLLGEERINYWHELHTGFAGRQPF